MSGQNRNQLVMALQKGIKEGAPLYNDGDLQGCYNVYARVAQEAAAMSAPAEAQKLQQAIQNAAAAKEDVKEAAWILRRCFDALLDDTTTASANNKRESLADLLKRAIREGVPLYNQNDHKGCFEIYMEATKYACEQEQLKGSAVGQLLAQAADEAMAAGESGDYGEAAWVLRRCFDDILAQAGAKSRRSTAADAMNKSSSKRMSFRGAVLRSDGVVDDDDTSTTSSNTDKYYWQDEKYENTTDFEIGSCLSDVAYILRASIQPATYKRFTGKTYDDSFPGSEAVEVLTGLGLAKDRKMAVQKCTMLLAGNFLVPVSHEKDSTFHDGTHLYRFPDRQELQLALKELVQKAPDGQHPEGSMEAQLVIALQNTLDIPSSDGGDDPTDTSSAPSSFWGVSSKHLVPRRLSVMSPEQAKGFALAQFANQAERVLDIQDRTHLLKKYEKCFVGKAAVASLVQNNLVASKEEAIEMMKELSDAGLIHHTLYDHGFESSYLFYRFTSPGDLRRALDALAILLKKNSTPTAGQELVRHAALLARYQQFADLDVASILNSFFGCDNEEGWDLVDLQNWRNNMKRWGFGRREDQDDEMVDKLSPLALNVDPETWYDNLTEEERQKWESPWGILAQVAIFDQVPRSAFRGTPDAFRWDPLAIKASKIAIERGYFETAYKSTLNQFLVLLPLEHSESWEDQKLGVTLLLRMLSTVAVQDEGLSDYEIVKRLEFSKRLTTAFLEHAQVIAKFKRYPHRNKPLGRNTNLEERVWLASDLVPRWALSQQKSKQNVIQLPIIPLKKLTRR